MAADGGGAQRTTAARRSTWFPGRRPTIPGTAVVAGEPPISRTCSPSRTATAPAATRPGHRAATTGRFTGVALIYLPRPHGVLRVVHLRRRGGLRAQRGRVVLAAVRRLGRRPHRPDLTRCLRPARHPADPGHHRRATRHCATRGSTCPLLLAGGGRRGRRHPLPSDRCTATGGNAEGVRRRRADHAAGRRLGSGMLVERASL